jgi:transposase
MEAGKRRLSGNAMREANTSEVHELKGENRTFKELIAELSLELCFLKKTYVEKSKKGEVYALQSIRKV